MTTPIEVDRVFLIADLSGYTALTEAHGDWEAAKVIGRYEELAAEALAPGARLVERVGDELLVAAPDAAAALGTALRLRQAVESEPLFPTVRAGLHTGRVLERDGRYLGTALNLTARVVAHARAGQVLCTRPVVDLGAGQEGVEFHALGEIRFRNVVHPVELFEVVGSRTGEPGALDPVCRMQVRPETAPARLTFGGRPHYFCSFDCARAFLARPQDYASA